MIVQSFIAAAATGLVLFAAPGPDEATKCELDKLQGTWKLERAIEGRKEIQTDEGAGVVMVIDGDQYTTKDQAGKLVEKGTLKLDLSENPHSFDGTGGYHGSGKVIYKVEGDTWTIAFRHGDGPAPTDFISPRGSNVCVIVFKRDKK